MLIHLKNILYTCTQGLRRTRPGVSGTAQISNNGMRVDGKFLKVLLMALTLITSLPAFAMEAPEPVQKKTKTTGEYTGAEPMEVEPRPALPQTITPRPPALPVFVPVEGGGWIQTDYEAFLAQQHLQTQAHQEWKEFLDPTLVTLQTQEGQDITVPIWAANQSETIKNLIEDAGVDAIIPLSYVDHKTLSILIPIMEELASLDKQREESPLLYVPRALQPIINQAFQKKDNKDIEQITNAFLTANYLDVPFILNGIAAIIADHIPAEVRARALKALLPATKKDEALQEFHDIHLDYIANIPRDLWKYIAKHVTFRQKGITQEYSIANYIAEHGQPPLIPMFGRPNSIDLANKGLTSLFGLHMLQEKTKVRSLWLNDNCFFDLSLDLQPGVFDELQALEDLYLNNNQLTNLQPGTFNGLHALGTLNLSNNQLTNLQPGIFNGLYVLRVLSLDNNQLSNIQPEIFYDLNTLKDLYLNNNQLTNLLPGTFDELHVLQRLNLDDNQLTNLQPGTFDGLHVLQELFLSGNQLTNLLPGIFDGLHALQRLDLDNNQLSNLQPELFNGLHNLDELILDDNQLTEQNKQELQDALPDIDI